MAKAKAPTKQMISVKIEGSYLDLEVSLDSAIAALIAEKTEYEGKGFTKLNLQNIRDCSCWGNCDCGPRLRLYGERLETEAEFSKRIHDMEDRTEAQNERDRREFERLSKKFQK